MEREIYIILSNTGTLLSRTIKLYTRAPYNHTSISFDKELYELYSFGRKNPTNPIVAGFVKENMRHEFFKNATCCIYKLKISQAKYIRLKQLVEQFDNEKNRYRYNFFGLIGVMINHPVNRSYRYFCSQFVAAVLQKSGTYRFNKDFGLIQPSDFHHLKNATLVYEGTFTDYWTTLPKVS